MLDGYGLQQETPRDANNAEDSLVLVYSEDPNALRKFSVCRDI